MKRPKRFLAAISVLLLVVAGLLGVIIPVQATPGGSGGGPDPAPAISITKTVSSKTIDLGETVTYGYTVKNTGNVTLTGIQITDDVLGSIASVASLAKNDSQSFTESSTPTSTVTNTAEVTANFNGTTVSDSDSCTVTVLQPGLSITKTASQTTVNSGDSVTYTYVVTNSGGIDLDGVIVTDIPLGAIGSPFNLNAGKAKTVTSDPVVLTETTTNTVTATGSWAYGSTTSDPASATVTVESPGAPVGDPGGNGQNGTTLSAEKTASGSATSLTTYTFGITKVADPTVLDLVLGGTAGSVTYSIIVTPHATTTEEDTVSGIITVTNGGGVATEGLAIDDELLVQTGGGPFQHLTSSAVDVSGNPVLDPGETGTYPYSFSFTPVAGAQAYKNTAHVTITNHSGHLGVPFGPDPSATFDPPVSTGSSSSPASVQLSDTETAPPELNFTIDSVTINGISQSPNLAGPWTLNAPYAASYDLEITKTVTASAVGTFILHDVAAVDGQSATADVTVNVTGGSISGTKSEDTSGDGVADIVLSGITIELWQGGVMIASTTTDALGHYSFAGLAAGAYEVREILPDGTWVALTPANVAVNLAAGEAATVDFLNTQEASISGTKSEDTSGDGVADTVVEGITIELWQNGAMIDSTTTAADGTYSFTGLMPGAYEVREILPDGTWVALTPANVAVNLTAGEAATVDFLNTQEASISGTKFNDLNGNGVADAGEPPLAGVTITLSGNGITPQTAVTAADGTYSFTGLMPGDYTVAETVPAGFQATSPVSVNVTLTAGEAATIDFLNAALIPIGPTATGVITGHKWNDLNGNGVHDAGEPGIAGVTITLTGNGVNAHTTTTSDGSFSFSKLANGTYTVAEIVPNNMNATSSTSIQVTIVNGETITGVDFNNALKAPVVIQGGPTGTTGTTAPTTALPTTGIDMTPWLLVAGWLLLLGFLALAIGLLRSKRARYDVRP